MKAIKFLIFSFIAILILNSCQKEYSVESNGLVVPTGTWQFFNSSKLYAGNMDSAYVGPSSSPNTQILHLIGTSLDGTQTFNLQLYADSFNVGSYKASLFQSTFLYTSGGNTIYQAGQLIGEFIVNITSINATSITGTFSGSSLDSTGNVVQLSLGKFTSTFSKNAGGSGSVSSGVLGDSSGNCKPVILAGTYIKGIPLTSANTVQVQVTVTSTGTYTINTNTVNGVAFLQTGTFTSIGLQTITLIGSGNPTNSGVQNFTLFYGNSQCNFSINFLAPASGTLGGGGGNCTPFAIAGNYQQGIPLNATNTVQVQVNFTSTGPYSISTNTVDGVVFSNTGNVANTGVQTITLTGSGTPVNSGNQNFTVSFGSSNCSFSINFLAGVMPSGDYFPLTLNSNWTFGLAGGTTADSIHTVVIGFSPTLGANTYNTIASYTVPAGQALDSAYYRKPGGDYYQYVNYSNYFPFDQSVTGEFIFLKDNVTAGTTWVSPTINGTVSSVPVSGYIKMTLLSKAIPVTVGSFNFPDVIQVKYEYFVNGVPGALETDQRWFAKNVGEIYHSSSNGTVTYTYAVNSYQVF